MHTFRNQRTIAEPVEVVGFGYWSGRDVRVEFRPAAADAGICFVRRDLDPPARISATAENRIETPRRTTLTSRGVSVEMVEHVMAALAGLQIDNCEVWVDQAEMPGLDGSSQAFVDALDSAGQVELDRVRAVLRIREITRLGDEESWIEARPANEGRLSLKYRLDYGNDNAIGRQTLELATSPQVFRRELAASRTFMFKHEAEWLRAQGIGGRATAADLLVFDDLGPIENELRYEDECVRHKMLDLVGDLALAGCDLVGRIVAHRSGHRLNAELVRALLSEGELIVGRRRSA
jgi:UDP-3-O-acyl N-acetylglucosamine deacetylase